VLSGRSEATETLIKCYGCGAAVKDTPGRPHRYIGAVAGCWEVYCEILAKEYGEFRYPQPTHRFTVDTYAVQHPGEPNRQAIQSVNAHLVRLYLVIEKGWNVERTTEALKSVVRNRDTLSWLEPPNPNGSRTVVDVVKAHNLEDHRRLVEEWARDVWTAWRNHHALIRRLADQYVR
jgi:hypothetical protein